MLGDPVLHRLQAIPAIAPDVDVREATGAGLGVDPRLGNAEDPRDIFCVRADLPVEISEAITASLMPLSGRDRAGREILGPLNLNGFQPANDAAYDVVRGVAAEFKK